MRYFMAGGLGRGEADDLAQHTLLLALRGLGQLREPDKLLPWLFAIARRVRARARLRHGFERRHRAGEEELAAAASVEPGVDVLWCDRRRLERLEEAIATLPPQQRQCLLMRVREEASYADIASTLRLSPNTVRNHLAQARQALRAALASGPRLVRPARHMHLSEDAPPNGG
jgi:RNA polymerase sigma-70 factor (ECF subfamily)